MPTIDANVLLRDIQATATSAPVAPVTAEPSEPALPPTTTTQQDITTAGQRRINMIWEVTQAFIAILVVVANMTVAVASAILRISANEYPLVLSSSLFLVIGFYFSRTNHQAIGGTGAKPADQQYQGR